MDSLPIFALDFEGSARAGVREVGVVCLRGEELDAPWEAICRQNLPSLSPPWSGRGPAGNPAPPFSVHFSRLRRLRELGIFACHGSSTEAFLLRQRWPSPGFVPDWLEPEGATISWGPLLDSRRLGQFLFPSLRGRGLRDLIRAASLEADWSRWGEKFCLPERRRPHRALYDAIGCALLVREFHRRTGENAQSMLRRCLPGHLRLHLRQPNLFPPAP
ncbi:MAG: hypothetical protein LBT98_02695 [Puniceicoccales bacterium]|jgi:hypothetical protein|nr:hypothetical protein [Puniceicoccales bacterium]